MFCVAAGGTSGTLGASSDLFPSSGRTPSASLLRQKSEGALQSVWAPSPARTEQSVPPEARPQSGWAPLLLESHQQQQQIQRQQIQRQGLAPPPLFGGGNNLLSQSITQSIAANLTHCLQHQRRQQQRAPASCVAACREHEPGKSVPFEWQSMATLEAVVAAASAAAMAAATAVISVAHRGVQAKLSGCAPPRGALQPLHSAPQPADAAAADAGGCGGGGAAAATAAECDGSRMRQQQDANAGHVVTAGRTLTPSSAALAEPLQVAAAAASALCAGGGGGGVADGGGRRNGGLPRLRSGTQLEDAQCAHAHGVDALRPGSSQGLVAPVQRTGTATATGTHVGTVVAAEPNIGIDNGGGEGRNHDAGPTAGATPRSAGASLHGGSGSDLQGRERGCGYGTTFGSGGSRLQLISCHASNQQRAPCLDGSGGNDGSGGCEGSGNDGGGGGDGSGGDVRGGGATRAHTGGSGVLAGSRGVAAGQVSSRDYQREEPVGAAHMLLLQQRQQQQQQRGQVPHGDFAAVKRTNKRGKGANQRGWRVTHLHTLERAGGGLGERGVLPRAPWRARAAIHASAAPGTPQACLRRGAAAGAAARVSGAAWKCRGPSTPAAPTAGVGGGVRAGVLTWCGCMLTIVGAGAC
eukprot:362754-Chlamydomonas_euryale.AAC.9